MKQRALVFPGWLVSSSCPLSSSCKIWLAEMADRADVDGSVAWPIEEMAKDMCVVTETARKNITLLRDAGYIRMLTQQERVQGLIAKRSWSAWNGAGAYQCVWCHCFTTTIHHHHYPVPKSKGGIAIVDVCANCHAEFHTDHHTYFLTVPFWDEWFSKIQEQEESSNELSL